ncbi:MAG TPA: hypothetical protein VHS31_04005 [Tepidisphaeraceae bacterium]|jgi:hypothetical protein|nr:hypothetical protein [Tepidisphaeraceae bacterium]
MSNAARFCIVAAILVAAIVGWIAFHFELVSRSGIAGNLPMATQPRSLENPHEVSPRRGEVRPLRGPDVEIPNDDAILPFDSLNANDVAKIFAHQYAIPDIAALLPESLHPLLEKAVASQYQFALKGDVDGFRYGLNAMQEFWWDKSMPESYVPTDKQLKNAMDSIVGGPYVRMGFADPPFKVQTGKLLDVLPDFGEVDEHVKNKASKQLLFVTVMTAQKITPSAGSNALYRPSATIFVCDPSSKKPAFTSIRTMNYRSPPNPSIDLPLFLSGHGMQK